MADLDSMLDRRAIADARALLEPPRRRVRLAPAVGAAALLAIVSVSFALAMIAAPPVVREHTAQGAVR